MAEPHHHRKVGYSMIAVAASLSLIGLLQLSIGENVLFGDDIQRQKTADFENCKAVNFEGDECRKFDARLKIDELDSGKQISAEMTDAVGASGP